MIRRCRLISSVGVDLDEWVVLDETEIMLGENLLIPNLAGWKKERFPGLPKENRISVSPDRVCEILSQSTLRIDKIRKMPIYEQHEVSYLRSSIRFQRRWMCSGSNQASGSGFTPLPRTTKCGLNLFRK
ncbi:MAG: Uma2 family endonuclease [Syntrophobacteraceae bacterium]